MATPSRKQATREELFARADADRLELIAGEILLVHRWSPDGYTVVQRASVGETIRAEPFSEIELHVGMLFGDDPDD